MSMVVQHNMQAANANRMLGITSGAQAKSTEKLSSGYKINRAADDAAGLTISEKMRKQIRGLDKASSNAQDGVSSVQTAEGALTEVHSMLQRMNELAVQAANGTNSKDTDRKAIQDEIDQLNTEIDRVAETTGKDAMEVFEEAMNNIMPVLEVKAKRIGGATYQVPIEVRPERRQTLALRWITLYSRKRGEKTQKDRLANEIMDAANNTGASVKKKEDMHKMAEANKAFSHFRF